MLSDKKIKSLSKLSIKKGRETEGKFLVEGFRIIQSALKNNAKIDNIYISNEFKASTELKTIDGLITENINIEFLE